MSHSRYAVCSDLNLTATVNAKDWHEYVSQCRDAVQRFRAGVRYFRWRYLFRGNRKAGGRAGNKLGLVLGFIDPRDQLWMGGSLYNEKIEKAARHPFNLDVALYQAIARAKKVKDCILAPACLPDSVDICYGIPQSLHRLFLRHLDEAYNNEKFPIDWK